MVRSGILNELVHIYEISYVEHHFIYSYLRSKHIEYSQSNILSTYFDGFEPDARLLLEISTFEIPDIKILENYLELLIPPVDRKLNGAFFTPNYIIDFIISEIKPQISDTNLDPSCGCGAFLIGLTDYYRKTFSKSIKQIITENIYGADILEYNIQRTRILLTIYAIQYGEYLESKDFNLSHQDSLRTTWNKSFDNILGNPPYVKFQDLSPENRNYLLSDWTTMEGGTFNLYFAFFELGYNLLAPAGKLGYITPNNYFTSLSGESLRNYFHKKQCVTRIVDFSHCKVFDAQTYTAITFMQKQISPAIVYDRIKAGQSPEVFLSKANGSPNPLQHLNAKKWRLLKTDEQQNIKTIEEIGTPIGKLFDICVGIATLKDDVFFVDGRIEKNGYYIKTTDKGVFKIETEAVRSVYKISDFKSQNEIDCNLRKIIFPYTVMQGVASPIPEIEFKTTYPMCYAYLTAHKPLLIARDKGKVKYSPFYVWGRTQGLARRGKKLLTPTFSLRPRFLVVEDEEAFFTNGYGLYFRSTTTNGLPTNFNDHISQIANMDVVQKILNSCVMDYYIQKTSVAIEGGYPCYQKNFIERFTIPGFQIDEIELLRSLSDKQEIDEFLIEKYQLNLPVPNLLL